MPVLLVKIGLDPLRPSALGIIRSLGRVGVTVNVVGERARDPVGVSRYVGDRLDWYATGDEDPDSLVSGLLDCAKEIGRKSIVACTDDAAAILIAERRQELSQWLISQPVPPTLPRSLVSKKALAELCREHGVLTPDASFPKTWRELESFTAQSRFPIVAKNLNPFSRRDQSSGITRLVMSRDALLRSASTWTEPFDVMLQEYLPAETSEDWFVHAFAATSSETLITFTGQKIRSWPPYAGFTADGRATPNEELAELARKLLRNLGYKGPADLDWRRDLRDGGYRLLDFNPRFGRQFRIFQSPHGFDMARLLHLDMTSRPLPEIDQLHGLRFVDDYFVLPSSYLIWKQSGGRRTRESKPGRERASSVRGRLRVPELAWFATDDPLPFFVLIIRSGWGLLRRYLRLRAAE